jgi:hypothetical protein
MTQHRDDIEPDKSQGGTVNQLATFQQMSIAMGKDYLELQGIKLGTLCVKPHLEIEDSEVGEM